MTFGEHDRALLAEELGIPLESLPDYRPRYNLAPTDPHFVLRVKFEDRELLPATWGLVNSWAKDASRAAAQINARSEQMAERPAFREAFRRRRCVVPADGFYEWVAEDGARQPFWFSRADGRLLLMAGVYESWQRAPGQWQRTFAVITTIANGLMHPYHDRMPVVLEPDAVDSWLNPLEPHPSSLRRLLVPPPDDVLAVRRVSRAVNSVRNDHAGLLEAVTA